MNKTNIKFELHQMIDQIGDDKVLGAVHTLLSNQSIASTIDSKPLNQRAFEEAIDQGEEDIKIGKVYNHEEVQAHFKLKIGG